ncbi:MAG: Ig-like domain-containing protein, partial [Psychrobacter sp.]
AQTITLSTLDAGTQTLTATATDAAGNTATDTISVTVDVTAPTAAITYSTSGPYKSGTSVTITATFNEAVQDSPVPKIAITGANTVSATNMAKTSATVYTYSHTVGSGDGNAAVVMSIAVDVAGNAVTATPTSGSPFVVDNTAPSIGSLSLSSQPDATPDLTFTAEASSSVAITSSGTSGTVGSVGSATGSAQTITLSTLDAGTQTLTATATDAAGNTATDTISVTVDVTAPTFTVTSVTPSSGTQVVGETVVVTLTAGSNETGLTASGTQTINGVTSSFSESGGGVYTITYTVVEGNTDRDDSGALPVSITLQDSAGNDGTTITSIVSGDSPGVDANSPTFASATTTSTTQIAITIDQAVSNNSASAGD